MNYNIKRRILESDWKEAICPGEEIGVNFLTNKTNSWNNIWEIYNKNRDILLNLKNIDLFPENLKPISLEDYNQFFNSLDKWVAENSNKLTFPKTIEGWDKAVKNTIESKNLETCILLSVISPLSFSRLINSLEIENNISKWFKTSQEVGLEINKEINKEIIKEKEVLSEVLNNQKENNYKTNSSFNNKDYILSPSESKCLEWLKGIIKEVNINTNTIAVETTKIDEKIKKKNLTDSKLFFDTELFGALIKLEPKELQILGDVWPIHQKIPLLDSLNFLSSPKFWKGLNTTKENKNFIIDNVLPIMLDISKLSFENKYEIGQEILKNTTKSPVLFMQRLMLWLNIGGELLEKPSVQASFTEDFTEDFILNQSEKPKTLLNWIIEQKNDMWTEEVYNLFKNKGFNIELINEAYQEVNDKKSKSKLKL